LFGDGFRTESEQPMAITTPAVVRRASLPALPVVIAEERCKGCEICVAACPKDALALDRGRVNVLGYHPVELTDAAACTSCAFCARVCPDAVFTVWTIPHEEHLR
jgi:2-oxoglutarate ferredoxin oxidoreductase subunit delta